MKRSDMPERERLVLELRDQGKTYREIAEWWDERVGNPEFGESREQKYARGRRMVRVAREQEANSDRQELSKTGLD